MSVATTRARVADRAIVDRFLAAVPLLSVFFWLCVIYAWQAWRHGSPWLFGDELELTQLSRSIADTGHAARRGEPHSFNTLYAYLMAPAWLIQDTHRAYGAVRYLGVIVMTLTAFPAYAIARMLVTGWRALFVAAAAAAIPAMAYSTMIVEEPLAYPYATFAFFVILRALIDRSRGWVGAAFVVSLFGVFVRGQLAILLPVFLLAALFAAWTSDRGRAWRGRWTRSDWLGFAVLAIGAAIVISAFAGHHSHEWLISTGFYKGRMLDLGLRAAGALTIGVAVFPVVAGLSSLWPSARERPTQELRAFRALLAAAIVGFGFYTAVKSTYVSTTFGTYTYERNLIYLAPLLFAATALWLERRSAHPVAVGVAGVFALYLILTTPYEMGQDLSYNAPGLAILQQSNRWFALTPGGAKVVLVLLLLASVALLLAPRFVRGGLAAAAAVAAAVVLTWSIAGEIGFANASSRTANSALSNIRGEPTWLDRITGGAPTLYLGQQMKDQNSEWLLEFWNRSIQAVWSLDGTAQGPGPTLTPDVHGADGLLYAAGHVAPQYDYVVADPGIDVAGKIVGRHAHRAGGGFETWRLIRADHPVRLSGAATGLYPDGWSGPRGSAYTRYSTRGGRNGRLAVTVSWKEWGGTNTAHVLIRMGTLAVGADKQPHIGRVTQTKRWTITPHRFRTFLLDAPAPSFRVQVTVNPKFRPHDLSPETSSDPRLIGAVVTYRFIEPQRTRR